MLTRKQAVEFLRDRPADFGRMLGFDKLGDIHNRWIKEMAFGREDHTLQGHRNSYKTTSLSIAIALIMILLPNKRILFMRKTDDDVKEIVKQIKNILINPKTVYLISCIYGVNLKLTVDNATELMTNLTTDLKGTSQLVGIGTGSSLTGRHYDYIFDDDIVNRALMVYDGINTASLSFDAEDTTTICELGACYERPKVLAVIKNLISRKVGREYIGV